MNSRVKKLIEALSGTADGAFAMDGRRRICYWNAAAVQLLGHGAEEVLGRPCYEVIQGCTENGAPHCQTNCRIRVFLLQKRLPANFDVLCRHKEGHSLWFNFSTISLDAGETESPIVVHLFRPIQQRKQIEQAARHFMSALDQRNPDRTKAAPHPPANGQPVSPCGQCPLTRREFQIVSLYAEGLHVKEVAMRLEVSPLTVRNHTQAAFRKLGVNSKSQAVAFLFRNAWVSPEAKE